METTPLRLAAARPIGAMMVTMIIFVIMNTPAQAGPKEAASFQVRNGVAAWTAELDALFTKNESDAETAAVWLYLRDKEVYDSAACERALAEHAETLGQPALERRRKALPEPWVDFYDLPVAERYLDQLSTEGIEIRRVSRWLNAVSANVTRSQIDRLLALPFVSEIRPVLRGTSGPEPDSRPPLDATPRSRGAGDPFDYGPSRRQLELMNALPAHEAGFSGDGVIVAVFDTGFFLEHEAFATLRADGRLLDQYDFINDDADVGNESSDDEASHSHGTITWSVIGGFSEGDLIGAAHGASFLLCKTEDITSETPVEEDNWIAAAEWAEARGAQVFSTSLNYVNWYEYADLDGDTAPMTVASDIAASRGIVVCVSAGNFGGVPWYYIGVPADGDSVIAVGAVDSNNLLTEFTSHGPTADGRIKPEVVAQGQDTYAAIPNTFGSDYFPLSGTSLSAPLVAGAAALILEANPSWSGWQVRESILRTAVSFTVPNNDRGYGLVDTWGAMQDAIPPANPVAAHPPRIEAWPVPSSGSVNFRLQDRGLSATDSNSDSGQSISDPDRSDDSWNVEIFDPMGRRVFNSKNVDPEWSWSGRSSTGEALAPGVYFVRATSNEWQATQKIVLRP